LLIQIKRLMHVKRAGPERRYHRPTMEYLENRTFEEIHIGDSASLVRTLRPEDIQRSAAMSSDVDPVHFDAEHARSSMFHEWLAHGMWGGALITTVLGSQLPGPGTVYVNENLHFARPITMGDTITVTVTVAKKFEHHHNVILDCQCLNQHGLVVISGTVEVVAPTVKIRRPRTPLPEVRLTEKTSHYRRLIAMAEAPAPISMAVVHPCDARSLLGAVEAARMKLIVPVLIGPRAKIEAVAVAEQLDLSPYKIVDVPHSHAAAHRAVEMAREGGVEALMKGSLHTDELMAEVVGESGLRTGRRISHVFVMDVPTYPRMLLITDAAVNIDPTLEDKVDIIQNAIDLAHVLGIAEPKVAVLSAVETVTPKLRSTVEAAALCKMADRGQITGGVLDGPLAFDNAVSIVAAKTKNVVSPVAGRADILVVPDLEAGNMIAKQLEYLADAQSAGIVLGARVPIVLTSRADNIQARLASCAVALLIVHHRSKPLRQ
jgi:phosphate acetyltransferase